MLVGARMTYPVITIGPRATLDSAKELMEKELVSSLPVVDRQGRLIGLINGETLNQALCDPHLLKSDQPVPLVEDIMDKKLLTVTENTPIEEAARIISDYDIKSLPVVRGNFVVGMITTANLNRIFLELAGARVQGIRLTVSLEDLPGRIVELFAKIQELGGNISTIMTFYSEEKGYRILTLKISGIEKYLLKQEITPLVTKIIDIR
mgnify:CR=1 FL=1